MIPMRGIFIIILVLSFLLDFFCFDFSPHEFQYLVSLCFFFVCFIVFVVVVVVVVVVIVVVVAAADVVAVVLCVRERERELIKEEGRKLTCFVFLSQLQLQSLFAER